MAKQIFKNIKGVTIPVIANNYCYVLFERLMGHPASYVKGMEDSLAMLYCGLKAGAWEEGIEFTMDFDEFIHYTDKHPEILEEGKVPEEEKKLMPEDLPAKE